jgi:hypothetical protein
MSDLIFVPFERYKAEVYYTLIGGMVYGQAQETRCYSSNF